MFNSGCNRVAGSSTAIGTIPYRRNGKSLAVSACGCNNEILINTFGAMAAVIGIETFVSPLVVFSQRCSTTSLLFSILIKARPELPDGNVKCAVSPTLYLSLSVVKSNIFGDCPLVPSGLRHQFL